MIGRPLLIHLCLANMRKIRSNVQELKIKFQEETLPNSAEVDANMTTSSNSLEYPIKRLKFPPGPMRPHTEARVIGSKGQLKDLTPNRVTPDTNGLTIAERDKARYQREKGIYKPKRNSIGTKGKRKPLKPVPVQPRQAPATRRPKSKHDMLRKHIAEKQAEAKMNLRKKKNVTC